MIQECILQNVIGNILRPAKKRHFERPNWCRYVQCSSNFGGISGDYIWIHFIIATWVLRWIHSVCSMIMNKKSNHSAQNLKYNSENSIQCHQTLPSFDNQRIDFWYFFASWFHIICMQFKSCLRIRFTDCKSEVNFSLRGKNTQVIRYEFWFLSNAPQNRLDWGLFIKNKRQYIRWYDERRV